MFKMYAVCSASFGAQQICEYVFQQGEEDSRRREILGGSHVVANSVWSGDYGKLTTNEGNHKITEPYGGLMGG